MKTAQEWFELLPDEVREKAVRNTPNGRLNIAFPCLETAILGSFEWHKTPKDEGIEYWHDQAFKASKLKTD